MSQGRTVAVREAWYAVGALRARRRSRAAVERRAPRGIRRIIEHARREVPHYRDQLDLQLPMHVVPGERIELTPGGKGRLVSTGYRPVGEAAS